MPHEFLIGFVEQMRGRQATRYDNFRRLQNIYEWGYKAAYALAGSSAVYSSFGQTQDAPIDEDLLAYNAAANVIDTIHAKVTKNKTTIMPLTTGGNYLQRTNAKRMGQCVEGELEENHFQDIRKDYVRNGLVQGTGWVKVFSEWGRVKIERAAPRDIFVDDGEGRYRSPRCMYHVQYLDRYVLKELYGIDDDGLAGSKEERSRAILAAPSAADPGGYSVGHDQVQVVEGWHLPSRPIEQDENGEPVAHDGRHTLCIEGATLVDDAWNWNRFPFARYAPFPRDESIWGLSAMHKLASGQREFEKFTQNNQIAFQRMTGSHIIAPRQANVKERDISNDKGTFIEYDGGVPPQVWNPEAVSMQTLQYTAAIPDNMMRFMGVSPLSASSQLPAGLQQASGKALQVFDDFESERLVNYHDADAAVIVDVAEMVILVARDLVEQDSDYKVRIRSKKAIENVKWSDVMMDQEDFVLSVFPVSMLAKTPSAKFQQLQELLNAGAITIEQFKRLFEIPDLEAENDIDTADVDIVDKMLAQIVYEGKSVQPQPFDDLMMAIGRTRKFINLMRTQEGIPEARIDALHDFLLSLQDLQQQAAPPPPPMPPMPGPGPISPGAPPMPGPPMPPPGPPMGPMPPMS